MLLMRAALRAPAPRQMQCRRVMLTRAVAVRVRSCLPFMMFDAMPPAPRREANHARRTLQSADGAKRLPR